MKTAVISGATGAVGTALIQELIKNGIEVLVLCRKASPRNSHIPDSPLVTKKYCDLDQLKAMRNETGKLYEVFYHFAWEGTTGISRNDMYLQNRNVQYALDAVEAAKRLGCHTFIGAGSQAEYGRVEGLLKPDTPVFPETGYGMAKLCAGQMTREHAHQLGMKHIWVRILSVYGPNDRKDSLVMTAISSFLGGNAPKCTPGEQMWDYLYSGDAAKAFRLLADKGNDGKTYVLGSGDARPLADYLREIRDTVNSDCKLKLGELPYPAGQVMHLQADISELTKDTDWEPLVPFSRGIQLCKGE